MYPAALCWSFAGSGSNTRAGKAAHVPQRWFPYGAGFLAVSGTGEAPNRAASSAVFIDSSLEKFQVIQHTAHEAQVKI